MGGPEPKSSSSKLSPSRPPQPKNKDDKDRPPPSPPKKDTEEAVAEALSLDESEGGEEELIDLKKGISKKKAPSKKKESSKNDRLPQIKGKFKGKGGGGEKEIIPNEKGEEEDENLNGRASVELPSIQVQKQVPVAPPIIIKEFAMNDHLDKQTNEFTTELVRIFSSYFLRKNMKESKNFFF